MVNVNALGFGLGRTGAGLGRIAYVYRSQERHRSLKAKAKAAAVVGGAGRFPADGEPDGAAAIVVETLGVLREQEREILRLYYWDGLSLADIGRLLGCWESAVKVRLQRARHAFRKAAPGELQSVSMKAGAWPMDELQEFMASADPMRHTESPAALSRAINTQRPFTDTFEPARAQAVGHRVRRGAVAASLLAAAAVGAGVVVTANSRGVAPDTARPGSRR